MLGISSTVNYIHSSYADLSTIEFFLTYPSLRISPGSRTIFVSTTFYIDMQKKE